MDTANLTNLVWISHIKRMDDFIVGVPNIRLMFATAAMVSSKLFVLQK